MKGANIYLSDKQLNIIYNSLPDLNENDTKAKILAKTYRMSAIEFVESIKAIKRKILRGR